MTRTRGLILAVAALGSIVVTGCASSVGGQPAQITTAPTIVRPTLVASTPVGAPTGSSIVVSVPSSSPQVLPPSTSSAAPTSPASTAPVKPTPIIVPGSTVTLVVTASPVPPTSPVSPPPVTATRRSTVTATVTATGSASGDVQTIDAFQSPSGNIACSVDSDGVRCDIKELTFTPPKPAECSMGVPHAVRLATGAKPAFICISDTVADPGLPVLAYGSTTRAHGFTCVSQEDGMHCSDDGTGNGFRLARASYDLG